MSQEEYKRCLKDPTKLHKALKRRTPDYEKLQEFAKIIVSLVPSFPSIIQWNPKSLLKSWGLFLIIFTGAGAGITRLSRKTGLVNASANIRAEIKPIWVKISTGQSAIMHPKDKTPNRGLPSYFAG